ncbi:MAG: transporter [Leeuwenhoekiella sp.]
MKYIITACLWVGLLTTAQAQNLTDALRYGQNNNNGTARYLGAGGAFGALGGDLTAIGDNPAGSAIFAQSQLTGTLNVNRYENEALYFQDFNDSRGNDLGFSQLGGVFVIPASDYTGKLTLGFNYNRTNNYNTNYRVSGISNLSIDSYFLGFADGVSLDLLKTQDNESIGDLYQFLGENFSFNEQQAMLGFQAFVIEPVEDDPANREYISNISGNSFEQNYNYESFGSSGKFTFNLGYEAAEGFFIGGNLNTHFFDFERRTTFEEFKGSGPASNRLVFNNTLRTLGNGFSAQVGTILHLSPRWRVGANYDTPTWFTITEEIRQDLTNFEASSTFVVDPQFTNVYPDYDLRTPGKVGAGIAYVLGLQGFISFDYSYQDFANTQFQPIDDLFFSELNQQVSQELAAVSMFKIGAEYRYNAWSYRAGYQFEQSPYKNDLILGSLFRYSAGLGYSWEAIRLDLAYTLSQQDSLQAFYDSQFSNAYSLKGRLSNIVATLSFSL